METNLGKPPRATGVARSQEPRSCSVMILGRAQHLQASDFLSIKGRVVHLPLISLSNLQLEEIDHS